ncbi:protein eyes shut homolog [Prionailurus bengalensis]|uniref:protein eyes shut homolog n=1 Tax=Prionailurus bengalensis TaxID=37029 RepID=UPI001CA881DF|nr:protein eyes shut homolog [Prionailurus bengalensis]
MIEVTADGKPPILKKDTVISHVSQVHFESMYLGHIPEDAKIHKNAGHIYGFNGCIQELQVNNKEFFIIDEALRGKNIENCHVPWCARHLCHNNGTCISEVRWDHGACARTWSPAVPPPSCVSRKSSQSPAPHPVTTDRPTSDGGLGMGTGRVRVQSMT